MFKLSSYVLLSDTLFSDVGQHRFVILISAKIMPYTIGYHLFNALLFAADLHELSNLIPQQIIPV